MLKICWIWKIETCSEELVDGHQRVGYQPRDLFWGGQLSGSDPNPFLSSQFPLKTISYFTRTKVYLRLN